MALRGFCGEVSRRKRVVPSTTSATDGESLEDERIARVEE
jgi:hypothetical protein